MKEYIDREAVIHAIENSNFDISDCDGYTVTPGISIGKFYELINSVPNEDVREVKHGKWIDTGYFGIHHMKIAQCSSCKRESEGSMDDEYCPNCGAKIDLEDSNG